MSVITDACARKRKKNKSHFDQSAPRALQVCFAAGGVVGAESVVFESGSSCSCMMPDSDLYSDGFKFKREFQGCLFRVTQVEL